MVKVNVARSPEEADLQAQGVDVLQQMFEEDAAPIAAEALEPIGETAETEAPAEEAAPVEEAAEASAESDGKQA